MNPLNPCDCPGPMKEGDEEYCPGDKHGDFDCSVCPEYRPPYENVDLVEDMRRDLS
jgi:hypothetical protein